MEKSKTLLQKYEIPLNHLDFAYIKSCKNGREMEKIVHILRSGEEGFYPDLTKCAEEKLKELKPNSKYFRFEQNLGSRDSLNKNEWKPIYDWQDTIRDKDGLLQQLRNAVNKTEDAELDLPPVRKTGKIVESKDNSETPATTAETKKKDDVKDERIKSTDYSKWDKYDPEVEILRMDLAEERTQEEIEIKKNRLNTLKSAKTPKITEIQEAEERQKKLTQKLTPIEREAIATDHRICGNDYFRAKEYENAIAEYDRVIEIDPAGPQAVLAYNNRAISYIKLKLYLPAIEDCQRCLEYEPKNLKARLRLAEASYHYGRRRESYELYLKVLEIDAENAAALKAISDLRKEFGDLPPPNARRMLITEESSENSKNQDKLKKEPKQPPLKPTTTKVDPKPKEYDYADLVVPNRVVKSKYLNAAQTLGKMCAPKNAQPEPNGAKLGSKLNSIVEHEPNEPEIQLPIFNQPKPTGRKLIEEI